MSKSNDNIQIWCDGACSGNQSENNFGGWGVALKYGEHRSELFGGAVNTTNNKMELQAAIEALKALHNYDIPVEMYLDSNYVLQGITTWIHNWKKKGWKKADKKPVENKELWIELDELRDKFASIQFIKVKGHSDNEGNNLADQLANKGVDLARSGEIHNSVKEVVKIEEIKTVPLFEKLKLQIDNLEIMYQDHQQGKDVSTMVYWQVETINALLDSFELAVGADKIRDKYSTI